MRPKIILQLRTKHSCSHLCMSLCHPTVWMLWGCWQHAAVLCAALEEPHIARQLWAEAGTGSLSEKPHTCSKEGAAPPLGKFCVAARSIWLCWHCHCFGRGFGFLCKRSGNCDPSFFCPMLWIMICRSSPHELPGEHFTLINPVPNGTILSLSCEHEMNMCWGRWCVQLVMVAFGTLGLRGLVSKVDLSWLGCLCLRMGFGCVRASQHISSSRV